MATDLPPPQPPALYREADGNMVMSSSNLIWRFIHKHGATPLHMYAPGRPPILNEFPGSGSAAAWRDGQDPTETTSNGPMYHEVHIKSDSRTAVNNYFARETIVDTERKIYQVKMFCPDFAASIEAHDDAIPPAPGFAESGWYTPYHPGRFSDWINSATRPIVFASELGNRDGYLFIASELDEASPWAQKLRKYRGGRFAIKYNISLSKASWGAHAGIIFRASIPSTAANKHDAYNADGIRLNINREGRIEAIRVLNSTRSTIYAGQISNVDRAKLVSDGGLPVQIRTHNSLPGRFWVMIDGRQFAEIQDDAMLAGSHAGYYAYTNGGYVVFQERAPFDVGVELTAQFEAHPNWIVTDYTIQLAPGAHEPREMDRVSLPGVFLNQASFPVADRMTALVINGQVVEAAFGNHSMADVLGVWAGNKWGDFGLFAVPEIVEVNGQPAPGFHVHLDRNTKDGEFVMMLDALPEKSVTEVTSVRLRTRWASKINVSSN